MGWSEDLLAVGLITDEEYQDMKDTGYDIRHYGNTEALEDLFLVAYTYGLDELGDRLFDEYDRSIDFYEAVTGYMWYYDPSVTRWRDKATGRFVQDPYEFIRE
jgi:hypothetical protein